MLILILMALLPPLVLLIYIYKKDKVEKEPKKLIAKTLLFGVLCVIPTIIAELLLDKIMEFFVYDKSILGQIIHNFIVIALMEEFFKMMACKLSVWKNKEFNYTFDGVVYGVTASLGFAALENVMYVTNYGFKVAITRALMSIPGHAIFGLFMGMNLGMAKLFHVNGYQGKARAYQLRALFVPTILHGLYDFMCSSNNGYLIILFLVYIVALDIISIRRINRFEKGDFPIYFETPGKEYTAQIQGDETEGSQL